MGLKAEINRRRRYPSLTHSLTLGIPRRVIIHEGQTSIKFYRRQIREHQAMGTKYINSILSLVDRERSHCFHNPYSGRGVVRYTRLNARAHIDELSQSKGRAYKNAEGTLTSLWVHHGK